MQIYNKNNTMNVFNSTFNSVSFQVTRSKELCKKKSDTDLFPYFSHSFTEVI